MINLVIFGPLGSGKGTQAQKIKEKYGFIHFSTGDLRRDGRLRAEGCGGHGSGVVVGGAHGHSGTEEPYATGGRGV